jgi:PBP1b-binding outer membrane lipoprotein LpoB
MNKAKILICAVFAAMALTACSIEDNPNPDPSIVVTDSTNVDNPFESVTDQPAYAPSL